jgi:hypothetical protein
MTDDSAVTSSVEGEPMEGGAVSGQCTRPEQPQKRLTLLPVVAFCVAISLAASLTTLYGYDRWYAQKIVAVDIKGYIAQQRDNYLAGKLNDDELKRSFDHLERIITTIPRNRVVIMGDAVVRNAETIKP